MPDWLHQPALRHPAAIEAHLHREHLQASEPAIAIRVGDQDLDWRWGPERANPQTRAPIEREPPGLDLF